MHQEGVVSLTPKVLLSTVSSHFCMGLSISTHVFEHLNVQGYQPSTVLTTSVSSKESGGICLRHLLAHMHRDSHILRYTADEIHVEYEIEIHRGAQRYTHVNTSLCVQDYQPSTAPTTSGSTKESRELCALCNQSLMQHQAGGE
eukprot:1143275-Pelagomonas_calceolata.AAC.1